MIFHSWHDGVQANSLRDIGEHTVIVESPVRIDEVIGRLQVRPKQRCSVAAS